MNIDVVVPNEVAGSQLVVSVSVKAISFFPLLFFGPTLTKYPHAISKSVPTLRKAG